MKNPRKRKQTFSAGSQQTNKAPLKKYNTKVESQFKKQSTEAEKRSEESFEEDNVSHFDNQIKSQQASFKTYTKTKEGGTRLARGSQPLCPYNPITAIPSPGNDGENAYGSFTVYSENASQALET